MLFLLMLLVVCGVKGVIYYDSYSGLPITKEDVKQHDKVNNTFWCVTAVEPCDPDEGRRLDGSCNNLLNPSRGAPHTPFYRVLPPIFDKNFDPKPAKSGNPLPLVRHLRTRLVATGHVPGQIFTMLALHYLTYMAADVASIQDSVRPIVWKSYCCTDKGKSDRSCIPNKVPDDDPVLRYSDIRCLNMTRSESFQSVGCVKNDTSPDRIVSSTPLLDASLLYGSNEKTLAQRGRTFKGGLLKVEMFNGRIWPPSTSVAVNWGVCLLNQKPHETRCHMTPEDGTNSLLSVNVMSIWFWRYHNVIATELGRINRCWSDEKLFTVTRDIKIAIMLQIYYYELLTAFLGYDNLVKDGVLTPLQEFRDVYDEKRIPQVSLEYPYVLRWIHTIQDGALKMYDKNGSYMKQIPIVNVTLRTGYIALDDHLDLITQGSFRQGSAKADHVADPDITDRGFAGLQRATDIMTNDLSRNRYFGFQPYVKYLEFCFGKKINSFKDLEYFMEPERVEILKDEYESFEDIDLMAGIWSEKLVNGGHVPPTFYCLLVDQLVRNIVTDRHWYERPNRPNAFNAEQLAEIRKVTIARVLCDVGDTVTKIQPRAFLRSGLGNPMVECKYIEGINYSAWKDDTCQEQNPYTRTE